MAEGEQGEQGGGRALALIAAAAVVAAGLALVFFGGGNVPAPVGRGSPAPDFSLPLLGGEGQYELSGRRGRVVLVNFWATWCKPCEEEMPSMERLYRGLESEGFEIVAVSVDEKAEDVVAFQERMQLSFPIVLDPTQGVARAYQTRGFPESLLIDADGAIVERYVGPRDWRAYRDRIRDLARSATRGG